jgi:hypothetical protein
MDIQKIVALGLVVTAALYLGRRWVLSLRAFWSRKGGCEEGCGKCGMAQVAEARGRRGLSIPLKPKH